MLAEPEVRPVLNICLEAFNVSIPLPLPTGSFEPEAYECPPPVLTASAEPPFSKEDIPFDEVWLRPPPPLNPELPNAASILRYGSDDGADALWFLPPEYPELPPEDEEKSSSAAEAAPSPVQSARFRANCSGERSYTLLRVASSSSDLSSVIPSASKRGATAPAITLP